MELGPDFYAWFELLTKHQAKYLMVGAHAVAAHGMPRMTGDLDTFVKPTKDNAKRVLKALNAFGFGTLGFDASDFAEPDRVTMLGRPPIRIDILTGISGISFDQAWESHIVVRFGDLDLPFLGLEALRINKAAAGRPKDLADIAWLNELEGRLG